MKQFINLSLLLLLLTSITTACDKTSTPSGTLQTAFDYAIADDFQSFAELVYIDEKDPQKVKLMQTQLASFLKAANAEQKKTKENIVKADIRKEEISDDGNTATVEFLATYANGDTLVDTQKMLKKDGKWYLKSF